MSPEIEGRILDYALQFPTHGAQGVANELRLQDINVSASGVRGVWLRHDLETRTKWLLRLKRTVQDDTVVLSEGQIALLERRGVDFRCRHVKASRPGELLNQDTFYWGTLKGVGKVYVQVVVDVFCSLAFAKVYSSKMPVTTCELLYDRVLPSRSCRRPSQRPIRRTRRDPNRSQPDAYPREPAVGELPDLYNPAAPTPAALRAPCTSAQRMLGGSMAPSSQAIAPPPMTARLSLRRKHVGSLWYRECMKLQISRNRRWRSY